MTNSVLQEVAIKRWGEKGFASKAKGEEFFCAGFGVTGGYVAWCGTSWDEVCAWVDDLYNKVVDYLD